MSLTILLLASFFILIDQNKIRHHHNDYKNIQNCNHPLIYTLINNIKHICNYEYVIEKKFCYECYSKIILNKIKKKKEKQKKEEDTNKNDMNDRSLTIYTIFIYFL